MSPTKKEHHDETDIDKALAKDDTSDGSGFEDEAELPESDFVSFSEDDVENDHDGDNVGDQEDEK